MGPQDAGTERLPATVTVIGGAKVVIEYADGHTVYLSVGPDSFVLRWHLGLEAPDPEG